MMFAVSITPGMPFPAYVDKIETEEDASRIPENIKISVKSCHGVLFVEKLEDLKMWGIDPKNVGEG